MMFWILIIIFAFFIVHFLIMKNIGLISPKDAVSFLKDGALVIDVRSPAEFASGHLAEAINIPLADVEKTAPIRAADKNQALLLHCQAGVRSGEAQSKLKNLGYVNVFNLGSYQRAESIVNQAR